MKSSIFSLMGLIAPSQERAWEVECPRLTRHVLTAQSALIRLDPSKSGKEKVLFLPPISGHGSALIQDLAKPMMADYDVYVLDWVDPTRLPKRHADYGHNTQVHVTRSAIIEVSGTAGAHIVATCQAASPTILALDELTSAKLTLTLVAAPLVDGPGGACELFSEDNASQTFAAIKSLAFYSPNAVKMLPATTQLTAILRGDGGAMRNLNSSFTTELLTFASLPNEAARSRRIALMDARNMPERLIIEGLTSNFVERRHLNSQLDSRIPIHLVAGGSDSVVPEEQTFGIARHLPHHDIVYSVFSELDHFDLFSSSKARTEVSKKLTKFFQKVSLSKRDVSP